MSARPDLARSVSADSCPEIEFARSAENFPVARLGDMVLAMLPARDGGGHLASALGVARPLTELRRQDLYIFEGRLADEDAFRARVFETAEHRRELRRLGRKAMRIAAHTPWGPSQDAKVYDEGVVSHSTASHGGFQLSLERNALVPEPLRSAGGFYEEDVDWAAVAIAFPHLFTAYERRCAERTVKDWRPEAFEAIFGHQLGTGESFVKDRDAHERRHAGDWLVIAALRSRHHPGMTEVISTIGGRRDEDVENRRFLVPSAEYGETGGRFGFVVDPARHAPHDGPSGFALRGVTARKCVLCTLRSAA